MKLFGHTNMYLATYRIGISMELNEVKVWPNEKVACYCW